MSDEKKFAIVKVPAVTLGFWVIKIFATTLGETGGDALSMTFNLGYLVSTGIFAMIFIAAVIAQVQARKFYPWLYWTTIVATTTVGTTAADFVTRDLGIGYSGGSTILLLAVIGSLATWRFTTGSVAISTVSTAKSEIFYWLTIMFSQTLGTALGDWFADTANLGYLGAAAVFGSALVLLYAIYRHTRISKTGIFWAAFIITRPLGAVVGDFLDKPITSGGLALSRIEASLALVILMTLLIHLLPQHSASDKTFAH